MALDYLVNGGVNRLKRLGSFQASTGPYGSIIEGIDSTAGGIILGAAKTVISNPDIVRRVSGNYLDAMARVGGGEGCPYLFPSSRLPEEDQEMYLEAAVAAYISARNELGVNGDIILTGRRITAGDCYTAEDFPGIEEAIKWHIHELKQLNKVMGKFKEPIAVIYETVPTIKQAVAIAMACEIVEVPYGIRFVVGERGYLRGSDGKPDKETLGEAIGIVNQIYRPVSIGVNCSTTDNIDSALFRLKLEYPHLLSQITGIFANSDDPIKQEHEKGNHFNIDKSDLYEKIVSVARKYRVPIMGGCCGTDTHEIENISAFDSQLELGKKKLWYGGGMIVSDGNGSVLLVETNGDSISFPKGQSDKLGFGGLEPACCAAVRENYEETGVREESLSRMRYHSPLIRHRTRLPVDRDSNARKSKHTKVYDIFTAVTDQKNVGPILQHFDPTNSRAWFVPIDEAKLILTNLEDKKLLNYRNGR